jgi:hypothetical protein
VIVSSITPAANLPKRVGLRTTPMSQLGQTEKNSVKQTSSGLPLIADIDGFSGVRDTQQNVDALQPAVKR